MTVFNKKLQCLELLILKPICKATQSLNLSHAFHLFAKVKRQIHFTKNKTTLCLNSVCKYSTTDFKNNIGLYIAL